MALWLEVDRAQRNYSSITQAKMFDALELIAQTASASVMADVAHGPAQRQMPQRTEAV